MYNKLVCIDGMKNEQGREIRSKTTMVEGHRETLLAALRPSTVSPHHRHLRFLVPTQPHEPAHVHPPLLRIHRIRVLPSRDRLAAVVAGDVDRAGDRRGRVPSLGGVDVPAGSPPGAARRLASFPSACYGDILWDRRGGRRLAGETTGVSPAWMRDRKGAFGDIPTRGG